MRVWIALLLLAGCITQEAPDQVGPVVQNEPVPQSTPDPQTQNEEAPDLPPAETDATAERPLQVPAEASAWTDLQLLDHAGLASSAVEAGAPVYFSGTCGGQCALPVDWPPLQAQQWYELVVRWDGTQVPGVDIVGGEVQRGFDSARVVTAQTNLTIQGAGAVWGRATILGPDVLSLAGDERLPNIVTYAPVQIAFGGCDEHERIEQGATRCLRLGNAIGNTGDGPLQAVLPWDDGLLSPTGIGGFDQRILLRSGGHSDHQVGNADFHVSHAHFHYDGFARFSLYEWDEGTGLRGELAAQHKKSGFCFLDWGRMEDPDRAPQEHDYADDECLIPGSQGWTMGVTAGWFDFYWAGLTDQYIDVADVPDGTYELVSTADWNDSLREVDEDDNQASAIISLQGDRVEVLQVRSFYHLPDDTNQL